MMFMVLLWMIRVGSSVDNFLANEFNYIANFVTMRAKNSPLLNSPLLNNLFHNTVFKFPCLLINAQSIVNKMGELTSLVNSFKPKMVAITESWCKDFIGDAELYLQNYVMYRCDRCNTTGGGVLLYVHDSLQSVSCTPLNDLHINEAVWCTIQLRNNDKMLVGVVYRSPNSSFDNSTKIINLIPNLSEYVGYSYCLLMGDFNFPNINWSTMSSPEGDQSLSTCFLNACKDGFLTQHVTKPTRHRHGQNPSLLDLVFTSDPHIVMKNRV